MEAIVKNNNAIEEFGKTLKAMGGSKANRSKIENRNVADAGFQVDEVVLWTADSIYNRKMTNGSAPCSLTLTPAGKVKELYLSQITRSVIPTDAEGNPIDFEGQDRVSATGTMVDLWLNHSGRSVEEADNLLDGAHIKVTNRKVVPCMRTINGVRQFGNQTIYDFDIIDPKTGKAIDEAAWLKLKEDAEKKG